MHHTLTRASILLALMLVLQSLRLVIPLPPFISMFVIGSLVNACLLVAAETAGWRLALVLAVVAPLVAYLQQVLPLPVFIIPVAAANITYIAGYSLVAKVNRWAAVVVASAVKMLGLYLAVSWVLSFLQLPDKAALILKTMFSWPQFITGILGGACCLAIVQKLKRSKR